MTLLTFSSQTECEIRIVNPISASAGRERSLQHRLLRPQQLLRNSPESVTYSWGRKQNLTVGFIFSIRSLILRFPGCSSSSSEGTGWFLFWYGKVRRENSAHSLNLTHKTSPGYNLKIQIFANGAPNVKLIQHQQWWPWKQVTFGSSQLLREVQLSCSLWNYAQTQLPAQGHTYVHLWCSELKYWNAIATVCFFPEERREAFGLCACCALPQDSLYAMVTPQINVALSSLVAHKRSALFGTVVNTAHPLFTTSSHFQTR